MQEQTFKTFKNKCKIRSLSFSLEYNTKIYVEMTSNCKHWPEVINKGIL